VTKLMDYSNTVCAATQWVPPETGLQLITTSQRHIRLTDGFSAANYLQVNKCIKIIKATVASLRLVSPGAATDRSHPSTLSTLRVSTTTLGQFQSVVKTVLFRLAYGTWLGSFVTVQAVRLAPYKYSYLLTYLPYFFLKKSDDWKWWPFLLSSPHHSHLSTSFIQCSLWI